MKSLEAWTKHAGAVLSSAKEWDDCAFQSIVKKNKDYIHVPFVYATPSIKSDLHNT